MAAAVPLFVSQPGSLSVLLIAGSQVGRRGSTGSCLSTGGCGEVVQLYELQLSQEWCNERQDA